LKFVGKVNAGIIYPAVNHNLKAFFSSKFHTNLMQTNNCFVRNTYNGQNECQPKQHQW